MGADRADPWLLWSRAATVAGIAVFLGAWGHVTAGGMMPHPIVAAVVAMLGVPLSAALLRGPASSLRMVVLVGGGQALTHAVLSATGGHVERIGEASAPVHQHQYHDMLPASDSPSTIVSQSLEHGPMMLAHAAAAALVGLWLAVGERALWNLLVLVAGSVTRAMIVALVCAAGVTTGLRAAVRSLVHTRIGWPTVGLRVARMVGRRGPPALVA